MQLREYLDATSTTVRGFADKLGVTETTVYRWLGKRRTPNIEQMRAIHAATRGAVSPNDWVLA